MGIKEELAKTEFYHREYSVNHLSYDKEIAFYESIKNGDMRQMKKLYKPLGSEGFGSLSTNGLRNLKYHLVITVAFITRYCIEGGLEMETAYNMSDIYINRIDGCNSEDSIKEIHMELCQTYVLLMQKCRKEHDYSKAVLKTMDYIYDHLHNKMSLEELAENAEVNCSYLSRLFHKETGVTIVQYIAAKRVDAAKNLLVYTDYTPSEIANYLCYSTESYFIYSFRKTTGYTPKKFREYHFRKKPA